MEDHISLVNAILVELGLYYQQIQAREHLDTCPCCKSLLLRAQRILSEDNCLNRSEQIYKAEGNKFWTDKELHFKYCKNCQEAVRETKSQINHAKQRLKQLPPNKRGVSSISYIRAITTT